MSALLSLHSVVVATREHVSCTQGEESSILNLKNSVYYGLDPVGTRIWKLLREPRSVCELRDILLDEYEVETELCEQNLFDLLEEMLNEGLVEVQGAKEA